jgi:hypothetical protein
MASSRAEPTPRAWAIAEGLVRTGRAASSEQIDDYIRVSRGDGEHYWVSYDGGRVLRGTRIGSAEELQAGFVNAMARAGEPAQ